MYPIERLLSIMARLRDPAGGCPWDLEQDFASISPHTIEEAYEVDEAIESGDLDALRDELGDLLFQVVFQARLAEEQGAFDFAGVVDAITDKLVRRHPHIFADAQTPSTAEGQRLNWEEMKAAERAAEADAKGLERADPFSGIPRNLPALARSAKITGRIDRLSQGDPGVSAASAREALSRVEDAQQRVGELLGDDGAPSDEARIPTSLKQQQTRAIGRALQSWVEVARRLGIEPEQALRSADDARVAAIRESAR